MAQQILSATFNRVPELNSKMSDCVSILISNERDNTKDMIESILYSEEGFLFTNDYQYLHKRANIVQSKSELNNQGIIDDTNPFVAEIKKRVDEYFQIVVRTVRDTIPKIIGFWLVKRIQDKIQL